MSRDFITKSANVKAALTGDEIYTDLYGNQEGQYFLLTSYVGLIPPARVGGLIRLGSPSDVFTMLNYHLRQSDIAHLTDVSQQTVARYIEGSFEPNLDPQSWRLLVQAYFDICNNSPAHRHTLDFYKQNVPQPGKQKRILTPKRKDEGEKK